MSGKLHLRFASDMPPAAVEVVAPDLQTVGRVWLGPGDTKEVEVPSEGSFVRIHMPSGNAVILHDPGNMNREISRASLAEHLEEAPGYHPHVKRSARPRHAEEYETAVELEAAGEDVGEAVTTTSPSLGNDLPVTLSSTEGPAVAGRLSADARSLLFEPGYRADAYDLRVQAGRGTFSVRLPGSLARLTLDLTAVEPVGGRKASRMISVGVATRHEEADALGAYLARGDLHSAASMTSWVEAAEQMLYHKMADPSAATVGAYLLLKLRRLDLMRTWPRNLADHWPALADGNILWAWQLIYERGDAAEITRYLRQAATNAHLPVFSEGLKLLSDGLRLLGTDAAGLVADLNRRAGIVLWDSPFTAVLHDVSTTAEPPLRFEVGYAAA